MPSFARGARRVVSGLLPKAGAAQSRVAGASTPVRPALNGRDFAAILNESARRRSAHFSLHWRSGQAVRLGLVVSRKLAGSNVRRNLVKRHAREIFRLHAACLAGNSHGLDVVLRVVSDLRGLGRQAEHLEMRGLFLALPTGGRREQA